MPSRAVEDEDGMGTWGDGAGDLGEVGIHRFGVDQGQDQAGSGTACRTDGAEDVAPLVAGVAGGAGPCAAPGPDAGQGSLLADARLILEPDLQRFVLSSRGNRGSYGVGEVFLNAT